MIYAATREDLPTIVDMALRIPDELGFEKLPPKDPIKVTRQIFERWLEAPIFVYKEDGRILGMVGVTVDEMWWSTEKVLTDYVFYILPEHRSLKVMNALVGAVRDFAKLNKLPVITTFMSSDRTPAKEAIFKKKGFKHAGFIVSYGF